MPETPEVNGFMETVSNGKGVYDDGVETEETEAEEDEIKKESAEGDVLLTSLDRATESNLAETTASIVDPSAASTDRASLDLKEIPKNLVQARNECKFDFVAQK